MKCFYHPQAEAVGMCKNCSKGICHECAADVGNGIACKDKCETQVVLLNQTVSRNIAAYQKTSRAYVANAIIYTVVGLIMIVFSQMMPESPVEFLLLASGAAFLLGAAFSYSTAKKFER